MSSRPHPLSPFEQHQIFLRTFGRLDPIALGTALALTVSLAFTASITIAVMQDASDLKQQLDLLGNYFPGFDTTPARSILSIPYGATLGFFLGFSFATARNIAVCTVLNFVKLSNFTVAIEQTLDD